MKEICYGTFSLKTHRKNWRLARPNVCQFELTFGCGLHCSHCYTDCYNQPEYLKKELTVKQVRLILDKLYQAGVIWICFTGGDPLTRPDFLESYAYAKEKGFIVTLFTNASSMDEDMARYLKESPPFAIEMTLNAVSKDLYEKISQVKDSFEKAMDGIRLILKYNLPLKIKTQVTRHNLEKIPEIERFLKGIGMKFLPNVDLFARLNRDKTPCSLRISPGEVLNLLYGNSKSYLVQLRRRDLSSRRSWTRANLFSNGKKAIIQNDCGIFQPAINGDTSNNLFNCAVGGGDGIHIDPYGNTFPCNLIRKPSFSLLEEDIKDVAKKVSVFVGNRKFTSNSRCKRCDLRAGCRWCPGRAYVETGDMENPIDYYCNLRRLS